jgi:hypothetical protein
MAVLAGLGSGYEPGMHAYDENMSVSCAEALPAEWVLGDAAGPVIYTGMQLTHFICRNCKWTAAADSSLAMQRDLQWIDISYNPLGAPATLPPDWADLPLVAIKVSKPAS